MPASLGQGDLVELPLDFLDGFVLGLGGEVVLGGMLGGLVMGDGGV